MQECVSILGFSEFNSLSMCQSPCQSVLQCLKPLSNVESGGAASDSFCNFLRQKIQQSCLLCSGLQ